MSTFREFISESTKVSSFRIDIKKNGLRGVDEDNIWEYIEQNEIVTVEGCEIENGIIYIDILHYVDNTEAREIYSALVKDLKRYFK